MSEIEYIGPIECIHCCNTAPMKVVAVYDRIKSHDSDDHSFSWNAGEFFQLAECPACGNILLREGFWHSEFVEEFASSFKLLYPTAPDQIEGLPSDISSSYDAAMKVKDIDSNAFAVLLGRILDLVCLDKEAQGDTLFERLKDLATKGILPEQLVGMAQQVRQLRNIGAHANLGELTKSEKPILEALNRAILEYVYTAPALIDSVQNKIDRLQSASKS